jgi:hypothetical protein
MKMRMRIEYREPVLLHDKFNEVTLAYEVVS